MFGLDRLMAFNSSRERLRLVNAAFAATIPNGSLVLDAGAGESPYRDLLSHVRYESADFKKVEKAYAEQTYVCDLTAIPVEDGRFDALVFNQVLEHVPRPQAVVDELFRVLKPGGRLIYSGPLFYEEHEQPYDFYRYTQFGLRHIFGTSGFAIERLEWLEGYFGTVAYQLNTMARYLPWRPAQMHGSRRGYLLMPWLALLKAGCALSSILFHRLEMHVKYEARGYPKNYVLIARKPS